MKKVFYLFLVILFTSRGFSSEWEEIYNIDIDGRISNLQINVLGSKTNYYVKKENNNATVYIKKGISYSIDFTNISYSHEDSSLSGHGYTVDIIQKNASYKNSIIYNTEERFDIIIRGGDSHGNTFDYPLYTLEVKYDSSIPVINCGNYGNEWTRNNVNIEISDKDSGLRNYSIGGEKILKKELSETGKYELFAVDNVGNEIKKTVYIDKISPEINVGDYISDWSIVPINVSISDIGSGLKEYSIGNEKITKKRLEQTGLYEIKAIDYAGNNTIKQIKIDVDKPILKIIPYYNVDIEKNSIFKFDIEECSDKGSGNEAFISLKVIKNGNEENININEKTYSYRIGKEERQNDTNISFYFKIKDIAGNETCVNYENCFIPAVINIKKLTEKERNLLQLVFSKINTNNYSNITLERILHIPTIDLINFDEEYACYIPLLKEAKKIILLSNNIDDTFVYTDKELEKIGLTHKKIGYTCQYTYENPVKKNTFIQEETKVDGIEMPNNPGKFKLKIKGGEGTSLTVDGNGIVEGKQEDFKMPESGTVGLEIQIEDKDAEPYVVNIQGKVVVETADKKYKLEETHTNPIGVSGNIINGKFTTKSGENGKKQNEGWVELGTYNLEYNTSTVFEIKMTEGFPEMQENTEGESIKLYVKAPEILGGSAKLIVGKDADYNTEGITARPWQKMEMELVPNDGGPLQNIAEWDFGNGKTGKDYTATGNRYTGIYYEQAEDRDGALSKYEMIIKVGEEEEKFNINIIDTQFGELYGNEVWRGDHIIRKEIIVPEGITLQIGDTEHSEKYDSIECLCIGDIQEEEKAGITVEEGGILLIDSEEGKKVRFVQAILDGTNYIEIPEDLKSKASRWKGLEIKGSTKGNDIVISDAECGINIEGDGKLEFTGTVEIEKSTEGIEYRGKQFKAQNLRITDCNDESLVIANDAQCGNIEINKFNKGIILCVGNLNAVKINLNDGKKGIWVQKGILDTESIIVTDCEKYGIFNEGKIENIKTEIKKSRLGYVQNDKGTIKTERIIIDYCNTGIHLLGGIFKVNEGTVTGCVEYGIKKEKDGLYDYTTIIIDNCERDIYENGIIYEN